MIRLVNIPDKKRGGNNVHVETPVFLVDRITWKKSGGRTRCRG